MLKFLLGAAVDHPAVQGAAGVVRARVDEKLHGEHAAVSTNGHVG